MKLQRTANIHLKTVEFARRVCDFEQPEGLGWVGSGGGGDETVLNFELLHRTEVVRGLD